MKLFGDDFDPEEVRQYVGLVTANIRRKGERRPHVPIPRQSFWRFSTGEIESDVIDVYEMSEILVAQLTPYTKRIAEISAKLRLTCVLQVVLWIDQDETKSMPSIGFERSVLDFLQAVNGTIDIDTYRH